MSSCDISSCDPNLPINGRIVVNTHICIRGGGRVFCWFLFCFVFACLFFVLFFFFFFFVIVLLGGFLLLLFRFVFHYSHLFSLQSPSLQSPFYVVVLLGFFFVVVSFCFVCFVFHYSHLYKTHESYRL